MIIIKKYDNCPQYFFTFAKFEMDKDTIELCIKLEFEQMHVVIFMSYKTHQIK